MILICKSKLASIGLTRPNPAAEALDSWRSHLIRHCLRRPGSMDLQLRATSSTTPMSVLFPPLLQKMVKGEVWGENALSYIPCTSMVTGTWYPRHLSLPLQLSHYGPPGRQGFASQSLVADELARFGHDLSHLLHHRLHQKK